MGSSRFAFRSIGVFVAVVWTFATSQGVSAQAERTACPDVEGTASASEHVQCWMYRQRSSDASCGGAPDRCLVRASAWCNDDDASSPDADLSDDQVASACLLALLGTRRLEAAREAARHVRTPTAETRACVEALTTGGRLRVVTQPPGGVILVDGRRVGPAPQEVALAAPAWEHTIGVQVRERAGVRVVERGPEALRALFDPTSCAMSELVIDTRTAAGATAATATTATRSIPARTDTRRTPRVDDDGPSAAPAIALLVGGGVVAVAGALSLVLAATTVDGLRDDAVGTPWTDVEDEHALIAPLRWGGGVALGLGVVAAGAGLVWLVTGTRTSRGDETVRASFAPRIGLGAASLSLRWELAP